MFISTSHGALNTCNVIAFQALDSELAIAVYSRAGVLRHAVCSVADVEQLTGFTLDEDSHADEE